MRRAIAAQRWAHAADARSKTILDGVWGCRWKILPFTVSKHLPSDALNAHPSNMNAPSNGFMYLEKCKLTHVGCARPFLYAWCYVKKVQRGKSFGEFCWLQQWMSENNYAIKLDPKADWRTRKRIARMMILDMLLTECRFIDRTRQQCYRPTWPWWVIALCQDRTVKAH